MFKILKHFTKYYTKQPNNVYPYVIRNKRIITKIKNNAINHITSYKDKKFMLK